MIRCLHHTVIRCSMALWLLLSGVFTGMAYGQTANEFTIIWNVQDVGGGVRQSDQYTLSHSIGGSVGGQTSSSSQYRRVSGIPFGLPAPELFDYKMYEDPLHIGATSDADKTGDNDSNKCHSAASSNIFEWGGWDVPPDFTTAQQMFEYFRTNLENKGSLVKYIGRCWIDGTLPPPFGDDWATAAACPGYFSTGTEQSLFAGAYVSHWMQATLIDMVKSYLHSGYGTTISLYDNAASNAIGHVLTVWGYRYDADGNVLGLWVTDSDDVSAEPPEEWLLPVEYSASAGPNLKWRVGADSPRYAGWLIDGTEALKPRGETTPTEEVPNLVVMRKKCVDEETGEEIACPADDNVTVWIGDQVCDDECKRSSVTFDDSTGVVVRVMIEFDPENPVTFKGFEVNGELWDKPGEPFITNQDVSLRPVIGCSHSD